MRLVLLHFQCLPKLLVQNQLDIPKSNPLVKKAIF